MPDRHATITFAVLAIFVAIMFVVGGSSRADVQSLVLLRPLSALVLGYAFLQCHSAELKQTRRLLWVVAAICLLPLAQLVPLPEGIWRTLPGRTLPGDILDLMGVAGAWLPISLKPDGTRNALFALMGPLAVLLLALHLNREYRFSMVPVLLVLGAISGLIGIFQVMGSTTGPLYFYKHTNGGSAVGLFANRNHHAVFLASQIPLLAVWTSTRIKSPEQRNVRKWVAIAAGMLLVPLILVTGSRAGLLMGLLAIALVPALYRPNVELQKPKRKVYRVDPRVLAVGFTAFGLTLVTIAVSRAQAIERLFAGSDESRFDIWAVTLRLIVEYFPVGSGIGSFMPVYQIAEPAAMLAPEYTPHAHNDWLEMLMTAGLAGGLLMFIAVFAWARALRYAVLNRTRTDTDAALQRMGCVLILMLGLASLADFPLRTPSLACLFALAAVWASRMDPKESTSRMSTLAESNGAK